MISLIWTWGLKIILPMAVVAAVIAGFMYMSADGDEEKLSKSKETLTGAGISVTIVLFSGVLQNFVKKPLEGIEPGSSGLNTLPQVIQNVSNLLLTLVGAFAVFVLVNNGVQYMLSSGDTEKIAKAKRQSKYALIGLVVAVLAYFIIDFVVGFWIS